jgi:hypothetical protein
MKYPRMNTAHRPTPFRIVCLMALTMMMPSIGCGQNQPQPKPLSGPITEIDGWLPESDREARVLDKVLTSPRRAELVRKVQAAMQGNPDIALNPPAEDGSYDPRLGLSEPEWIEFRRMMKDVSDVWMVASDSALVQIERNGDTLAITGPERLNPLTGLIIDMRNNVVFVAGNRLTYAGDYDNPDTNNGLHSRQHGHQWTFSSPKDAAPPKTREELGRYTRKMYNVAIAKLERDGSILIEISGNEIEQGVPRVRFNIPYGLREPR